MRPLSRRGFFGLLAGACTAAAAAPAIAARPKAPAPSGYAIDLIKKYEGWAPYDTFALRAGDRVTIAGVYQINPPGGDLRLQNFYVEADVPDALITLQCDARERALDLLEVLGVAG